MAAGHYLDFDKAGLVCATSTLTGSAEATNLDSMKILSYAVLFRIILLISCSFTIQAADRLKVGFVAPDLEGVNPFWDRTILIMRAVAEDLDIDLEIRFTDTDEFQNERMGYAIINGPNPPQYFLTGFWIHTAEQIQRANELGIKVLVFNAGIPPKSIKLIGRPRERYKNWIAEMTPNDREAGNILANILIEDATKKFGTANILAILSSESPYSGANYRIKGLESSVRRHKSTKLAKRLYAFWSFELASKLTTKYILSQDTPNVIWSLSDAMALAAARAARALDIEPGKQMLVGGFDWSQEGLNAIANGDMHVSMGGHFIEGAHALILIHDHFHGIDFEPELGTEIKTPMFPITNSNVEEYDKKLTNFDWQEVDFKQYSRYYNKSLRTHKLTLNQILNIQSSN